MTVRGDVSVCPADRRTGRPQTPLTYYTACSLAITTASSADISPKRDSAPAGCGDRVGTVRGGRGHLRLEVRAHSSILLLLAGTRHPAQGHAVGVRWGGQAPRDTQRWDRLAVSATGLWGPPGHCTRQQCAPNLLTFKVSTIKPSWGLRSYYQERGCLEACHQPHICPWWPLRVLR